VPLIKVVTCVVSYASTHHNDRNCLLESCSIKKYRHLSGVLTAQYNKQMGYEQKGKQK